MRSQNVLTNFRYDPKSVILIHFNMNVVTNIFLNNYCLLFILVGKQQTADESRTTTGSGNNSAEANVTRDLSTGYLEQTCKHTHIPEMLILSLPTSLPHSLRPSLSLPLLRSLTPLRILVNVYAARNVSAFNRVSCAIDWIIFNLCSL